jgi:hypothetical protein
LVVPFRAPLRPAGARSASSSYGNKTKICQYRPRLFASGTRAPIRVLTKLRHFLTFESPTDDGDPSKVSDVKVERLSQAPVDRRSR